MNIDYKKKYLKYKLKYLQAKNYMHKDDLHIRGTSPEMQKMNDTQIQEQKQQKCNTAKERFVKYLTTVLFNRTNNTHEKCNIEQILTNWLNGIPPVSEKENNLRTDFLMYLLKPDNLKSANIPFWWSGYYIEDTANNPVKQIQL